MGRLVIVIMKNSFTKPLIFIICIFSSIIAFSQSEQCGTAENLEFQHKNDPNLRVRLDSIERQNELWIKNNNRGFKDYPIDNNENRIGIVKSSSTIQNINALCGYNNTLYTTINAPTTLNQIVSPSNNCTWAGEYVRVNNLIAGNTYRISTIGVNNFDTILSIFLAGGGNPVAYNDDWNTSRQSEIYFTPFVSGNYDILIDEFGCISNELCASIQVELWYIPRPLITIPVVVHVIHNGENLGVGANISDAQIQSQIEVLNQDFRRLNSDVLFSPAPFRGSSADPLIQFCLAQQKPDGSSTNGINRFEKPTVLDYINLNIPSELHCLNLFTMETVIKPASIWNRDKYLNIWISEPMKQLPPVFLGQTNTLDGNNLGCNFESGTLGYAQLPGIGGVFSTAIPANLTDGVWIRNNCFGTIGNLNSSYNLGRTTTHEIGHWLNLKHIWGDEPLCEVDDAVLDTPLQSNKNFNCSSFPKLDSCSTIFPGVMFMNYMDYSNDNCLSVFTFGQSARMDSALFNQRASLLTSIGCNPSTMSIDENTLESNVKTYPNPFTNQLTIEANEPIQKVEIYNLLGQLVKIITTENSNNLIVNLDTSEISQGNYIAKIHMTSSIKSVKLVKK